MARRSHAQRNTILATLVATAVAALLSPSTSTSSHNDPLSMQVYSTAADEQRRVVLDDVTVILSGRTGLTVTQSPQLCEVALNHGAAQFEVKRESTRPLRVLTGSTVVRARAGRFSVRIRDAKSLDVMVLAGEIVADTTTIRARRFARISPSGIIVRELRDADMKGHSE